MGRTYDDAIRMATRDRGDDVRHTAEYLWTWVGIGGPPDPAMEILNKLDDMDSKSKTREEHAAFIKANYKKVLDDFYSKLRNEVEKMLKEGYKVNENFIVNRAK